MASDIDTTVVCQPALREASCTGWKLTVRQIMANRGFLFCTSILALLTIGFQAMVYTRGIQFRKLEVPLKRPLHFLDQHKLTQPLFELDPALRHRLYTGRISMGLRDAFLEQGFSVAPETDIVATGTEHLWSLVGPGETGNRQATYLIDGSGDGPPIVLAGYELLSVIEIPPEVVDSLGTEQYIQWILYDHSSPDPNNPANFLHLFITYYSGTPGQVPHVPEECYVGGGGYSIIDEWLEEVPMPALGPDAVVMAKMLQFDRARYIAHGDRIVMYLFHANGRFCPDRTCTRLTLSNPADRHAYFSKVELTFGTSTVLPTRAQAIEAGKRFMQVILPVLLSDHWPDWDAVKRIETAGSHHAESETWLND